MITTRQMKIFQIGFADNGMFVDLDGYERAKDSFKNKPVILYNPNKMDYSKGINILVDNVIGVIRHVDKIVGRDVIGTIDFFDLSNQGIRLEDLDFEFKNFEVTAINYDKEYNTLYDFEFQAVYVS